MSRLQLDDPNHASPPADRDGREAGPGRPSPAAGRDPRPDPFAEPLERWMADGLLTREQAAAIAAAERRRAAGIAPPRRIPVVAELVGYLGAALALAGAVSLAASFWTDLAVWARLTILGATSVIFLTAGLMLRETAGQARRLRGFLLLLSSAAAAYFASVFAEAVLDAATETATLATGLVLAAHAGALWWLRPRPLQHLACLAGLATAAGVGADLIGGQAAAGLAVWVLGAAWVLLGWRKLLPPAAVAIASGAVAALIGAATISGARDEAGLLLGLATALALLVAGTVRRRFVPAAIGTVGVLMTLPPTIDRFFAGTVGVPFGILLSGLILLGMTVLILRRNPRPGD
jgi:hypothetical protein